MQGRVSSGDLVVLDPEQEVRGVLVGVGWVDDARSTCVKSFDRQHTLVVPLALRSEVMHPFDQYLAETEVTRASLKGRMEAWPKIELELVQVAELGGKPHPIKAVVCEAGELNMADAVIAFTKDLAVSKALPELVRQHNKAHSLSTAQQAHQADVPATSLEHHLQQRIAESGPNEAQSEVIPRQ